MIDHLTDQKPDNGFEKPIRIDDISPRPKSYTVVFPENALQKVAHRLETESASSVEASFEISRSGQIILIEGHVKAQLVRTCVTSLEPMDEGIDDDFSFELEVVDEVPDLAGEVEIDIEAPDPITGDTIDLAEQAVQQVSLAMEPFPRKEGAEPVKDEAEQPSLSPFASLKSLKQD
ncbi:YceD family protein [Aquisalinus flavus]|uniref:Metal-binding protein n=1 Tax=Aquisalinus flavus TaxID=1526572 RepID=A0A8J2Y7L2_9PROT|nr:DUF177 domain-containing protein [Aquisalinus flavus]MBD0427697.1 DUF177 domain-containing protein [Aquisalinus flavus]UNE47476.1 DUF177 domain-containing protein [Aquisalinus flavus]GGD03101.1 metal-binding protein [Aquisalinus flavus]